MIPFLSTFIYLSHTTQHNTISIQNQQNTTKQQTDTPYSKSPIKREREREKKKQKQNKSFLYIITYREKTLPSINSRRLGPINSRCCTFTSHYLQEAMDPICFSTHVRCKPVLYYCLLRSCKTSKQHSLLY